MTQMIAKSWLIQWKIDRCIVVIGLLFFGASEGSLAQITPDNTLGGERSTVTPNVIIQGVESDLIEGGAIRGANLFHSFEQFNVGAGRGAYFTNPTGIANILTRVTGTNRSEILGRLGVLGNANLFLINPKGIVFGLDSSLDVQGSFLATTADAIRLGDTGLFSASQPATSNLLSVSPSAFWFNAIAAQPIINRSQSQGAFNQPNSVGLTPGLQVQPDRTLALIGGNVLLEGGRLNAAGGQIELGSVARVGNVSFTQSENRFTFGYDSIQDVSTLQSRSPFGVIALSNQAFIDASGEGGGDIQIRGAQLNMAQSSKIRADTLGAKNGGEIQIRTTETFMTGGSLLASEVSFLGTGTGGNIAIDTARLLMSEGAQISTLTYGLENGRGKGGDLEINASELIELGGRSVADSAALLSTSSVFAADAGTLKIDTKRLVVRDGSLIITNTFGEGKGGNLQINASESVEVIGESMDSRPSRLSAEGQVGNAGDLKIDTGRLIVRDGAVISSASSGDGRAGNINITTRDELQAENGAIETRASRSAGGAITINAKTIRLFGNSDIRSDVTFDEDNGGDITLNAGSILAFNDSDILAFARDGKGGNITFNTPAFFGENYRPVSAGINPDTLENNNRVDINATGAVSGIITIPDVSFIQNSLSELPENQINTDTLLASSCIVRRNQPTQGSFTVIGTGGLPQRPGDIQSSSFPTVEVETLPNHNQSLIRRAWQKGDSIVEPQGVYRLPNGKLVLSRNCP